MGLELFWVTHPIRSVIPSCLPDELWESASNVCTKDRLGNAIFFLRAVASMAALLPPRGPASDKCSSLFSVSCFSPTDCRGECNPSRCQKKLFFQISPLQTARMRSLCSQEGYSASYPCVTILQGETLKNRQLTLPFGCRRAHLSVFLCHLLCHKHIKTGNRGKQHRDWCDVTCF